MRALPLNIGPIHFVGIGGIGMSGIAEVLHTLGYQVQGSDIAEGYNITRLRDVGIPVAVGHDAVNLGDAQVVVVSTAVKRDNPEVVAALFATAAGWLGARGFDTMRGPASFSTNDECGLLVMGFDRPPTIMMPHNPDWYVDLIEGAGFTKSKDLLVYEGGNEGGSTPPERIERGQRLLCVGGGQSSDGDRVQPRLCAFDRDTWCEAHNRIERTSTTRRGGKRRRREHRWLLAKNRWEE